MIRYLVILCCLFCMACGDSPLAPTPSGSNISGTTHRLNIPWAPFVGVHCTDEALPGYDVAFKELTATGALRGIRVGAYSDGSCTPLIDLAGRHGLDVLGLVTMADYMAEDWQGRIDTILALYRGKISVFQIGNEIQNGPSWGEMDISIKTYTSRFMEIYEYIGEKYPDVVLMSQSTVSSTSVLKDTEEMMSLGLKNTDPKRVIIGMNVYSVKSGLDFSTARSMVPRHRVWITEVGIRGWENQIQFVIDQYPGIISVVGPSNDDGLGFRMYWYAMWVGDEDDNLPHNDQGFGLIRSPSTPQISRGPLYKLLAGI